VRRCACLQRGTAPDCSIRSATRPATAKESLLLGLPVPGIFVFKEEDSAKHVIADGQQRLKSLQFFYEGTFHERKFRLIDVHPRWRGKTFKELDAEDRQRLEDAIVHTTVFKQDNPSDKSSAYHVFRRAQVVDVIVRYVRR
jgi:hypothetical protein